MNLATRLHLTRKSVRCLLQLALAAAIPVASGQPANIQLPAPAQGSAAIAALGAHLPDVAKAYGLGAQELVTLFQTQPSLGVDTAGALMFACAGAAVDQAKLAASKAASDVMSPTSSVTTLASGTTVDAFKLHSLPGVSKVIYLDFTGHTTSGTSWNSAYAGGKDIVSAPYDTDGDPTTFSADERALIQAVWQRVAEDYAPFAVDVTTEDPGVEGLRKTTSSDEAYGIRVVISPTNWYNTNAGGTAYVGSFSASTDTPCFAFAAQLLYVEKYIADAVAHEVGHTLGLYHDGVTGVTEYYEGQGNWAPIMGVGYYHSLVQFSKGEYAGANNKQDDLAVIASYVAVAGDDHGNTTATATLLSGPNVATGGTIETGSDLDVFRFDASAGDVAFSIKGAAFDTNLDIKAELLNANGQVLQTSDNTSVLTADIAATLNAGTYFLRISCVGWGDPASNGYSKYGSLGNYLITGSFPTSGVKQAPVAIATASTTSGQGPLTVSFSGQNSTDSDGSIVSYSWNFGNGSSASGITASTTYTSAGTYAAVLTVVDNDGLASTASISINVQAAPNVTPVAVATSNVTSGTAPTAVAFAATGSYDPDGSIASYRWDFGDGTSATTASASKTYNTSGNYAAKLTVTDNLGATATSTVNISIAGNPDYDFDVYQFLLTTSTAKSGTIGTATITILDRKSRPVSGATVTLQWSGAVSGTVSGKTDSAGKVVFTSQRTKKSGSISAAVTSVAAPANGGVYDATIFNAPLVQSAALP